MKISQNRRSKLDRKCWEEEKGRGKGVPIREKRGKVGSEKEKENEHGKGRGKILKGILIILKSPVKRNSPGLFNST